VHAGPQSAAICARKPDACAGPHQCANRRGYGWEASDPEQGGLHYDLYLGTSSDPPLVASYLTESSSPQSLAGRTLYYWKVVAFDSDNLSTEGPVWSFTTGVPVPPPGPTDPSPADEAIDQNRALTLLGLGRCNAPLSYEVHFSATVTPPKVATIPAVGRRTRSTAWRSTLGTTGAW
jgi:hypothetical protein